MNAPTNFHAGRAVILPGPGGLDLLKVQSDHSDAEIILQGATVTSFQRNGEPPLLFLSNRSRFQPGQPVRGGIPIVFPWFGAREGAAAHGMARTAAWHLAPDSVQVEEGEVALKLHLDPECFASSPWQGLQLEYALRIGHTFRASLITRHTGEGSPIEFEDCLHTYFLVGAIQDVEITGLAGARYLDKMEGFQEKEEGQAPLHITSETDRVYQETTATVLVRDRSLNREIVIQKQGSRSTVVWNPWITKSKALADFGDEEYLGMVCVESGNIGRNQIKLHPGETHQLQVELSSRPLATS